MMVRNVVMMSWCEYESVIRPILRASKCKPSVVVAGIVCGGAG